MLAVMVRGSRWRTKYTDGVMSEDGRELAAMHSVVCLTASWEKKIHVGRQWWCLDSDYEVWT